MRIRCSFSDQQFTCRLLDNPTTRDLISMLPLGLTIEDFSTSEKLAHLPRRLDEGGVAPLLVLPPMVYAIVSTASSSTFFCA